MVRSVSLLSEEHRRLRTAMQLRGFIPAFNRHTFVTFGTLVGQLVLRSLDRAERIDAAMRCRAFDGRLPRPLAPAIGRADVAATVLTTLLVVTIGWIEWSSSR
jgi:cobalt/nickel transport system permease protein